MRRYADTTKAREMTGFECKVSLDEGLRNTVEWFKGEVAAGRLQI
jgi:nucleoside-diphosphate-sugar epimerase